MTHSIRWHHIAILFALLFSFASCSDNNESSSCEMIGFKFLASNNSNLSQDCTGTINGNTVTVQVPSKTELASLVASFSISGVEARVNNVVQVNGTTANDFSSPVVYTVVAEDNSRKEYTVSVVRPDKDITSFVFEKANNPQLPADAVGIISGAGSQKNITVEMLESIDRTALIPTFTADAAKITVNGVEQISGQTACDFSKDVEYIVVAEDNTTSKYTVNITPILAKITSFAIAKNNNPDLPVDIPFEIDHENKTITGYLTKWIDSATPDKFIAAFAVPAGVEVSVNNAAQESGVTANSFKDELIYTVSLTGSDIKTDYTVRLICPQVNAKLPVMRFSISLSQITSKEEYEKTKLEIIGNGIDEGLWKYSDPEIEIRLRGNSTMGLPKKPFRIKFPDKISPLGLNHSTEKNWVLLANDADKTLLRNAVALSVSRTLLQRDNPAAYHDPNAILFTAATLHVDVYVGDNYQGVYHLTDHVQRNPGRVDLKKPEKKPEDPNISGGYLMEIDGFADSEFSWFKTTKDMKVTLKYPDMEDDYTSSSEAKQDARYKYIADYVQNAENILFSNNFADKTNGWREYFDQSTLIDYYLISEFCGNSDAWWSTYIYKMRDSESKKIFFGPVWDFDIAFDNDNRLFDPVHSLMKDVAHEPRTWVKQFFEDPALKSAVKARWEEMKEQLLKNALATVDNDSEKIYWSRLANFKVWNIRTQSLNHARPSPASYDEGVEQLKNYIKERYNYLNSAFGSW